MKVSNRLKAICELINKNEKVLDIGTDHGYVPIFLIKNEITKNVEATEIVEGPMKVAKQNFLENKVDVNVFLSDGLKSIENPNKYDVIVIAGMGGSTISEIILEKKIFKPKIIMHPTNNIKAVRESLVIMGYKIIKEFIVYENEVFNVIIEAKKVRWGSFLTNKNIFLGPLLKKQENEIVKKYYLEQYNKYKFIYSKKKDRQIKKQIKWLKKVI